jgi:anti-sigma factor RsiW
MTCEGFDVALPDYLEGTLDEAMRARVDKHLTECVRCASLVRDLEKIEKDAAALPDLVPARDLWAGIEARIAAPVIPLVARAPGQKRLSRSWMAIAAAALVMSTAGVTYLFTARSFGSRVNTASAPASTAAQTPAVAPERVAERVPEASTGARAEDNSPAPRGSSTFTGNSGGKQTATSSARLASLQVEPAHSEVVYAREIEALQNIVRDRKSQLDSSTVVIIERNLQIIDAAIEQSKAALARDPASLLLSQQLNHALDKKVELLRTAAMLPAST